MECNDELIQVFKRNINVFTPKLPIEEQTILLHWLAELDKGDFFSKLDFVGFKSHSHINASGITLGRKTKGGVIDFCFRFYCKNVKELKRVKGIENNFKELFDDKYVLIVCLPLEANLDNSDIKNEDFYFRITHQFDNRKDHYWILDSENSERVLQSILRLKLNQIRPNLFKKLSSTNSYPIDKCSSLRFSE